MRWWVGVWAVAGAAVLVACGASAGGPSGSGSGTAGPSGGASTGRTSAAPSPSARPSGSGAAPPSSAAGCVAGHVEVAVRPGDAVVRRLCVRPGTVIALVLEPRVDDKRWTAVASSAPALVTASGWRLDTDGTAHASLRCAGTRGGAAVVTAKAKAPDVAGAAQTVLTLHVDVVPHTTQG